MNLAKYISSFSIHIFTIIVAGISSSAMAEKSIEITREVIQTERSAIIEKNMNFTEQERQVFWPLYRKYRFDVAKINDKKVELIKDYAANYTNLTGKQAQILLDDYINIEREKIRLKKSYVNKFRKILPSKMVTRYFQIENKLDAIINYGLAREIPLVW